MANKIRAIYIGDVRFNNCPVFELDNKSNKFIMLSDSNFQYESEDVYADEDFLVFKLTKSIDDDIEDVEML